MKKYAVSTDMKDVGYEIFIAAISVLSVINIAILLIPGLNLNTYALIEIINTGLTIIFLLDFIYRLFTAKSRNNTSSGTRGWADLLACAPSTKNIKNIQNI